MRLMDTDVCIDLLRKNPAAIAWIASLSDPSDLPGIPGHCAIVLVVGCLNKGELQRLRKFLARLTIVWPTEAAMIDALEDIAPLSLSHGLGGFDALIAATTLERGDTLLTHNIKHFRSVDGLNVEKPYTK